MSCYFYAIKEKKKNTYKFEQILFLNKSYMLCSYIIINKMTAIILFENNNKTELYLME
jgi:hypothetical protein